MLGSLSVRTTMTLMPDMTAVSRLLRARTTLGGCAVLLASALLAPTSASAQSGTLSYELRQPASRYPVQLITGKDCRSCEAGRQLLAKRGVPFAEKRVDGTNDLMALKRLTGATSLPVLIVGSQQVIGLVSQEWNSYLDAAGYPKDSKLPASWRNPAAEPLGPPEAAPKPAPEASPTTAAPSPAPAPADDPSRPKIRF